MMPGWILDEDPQERMDLIRKISPPNNEKILTIQGALDKSARDSLCLVHKGSAEADLPYERGHLC